jgi:thiol-disulfide isomerase/thioredoxin
MKALLRIAIVLLAAATTAAAGAGLPRPGDLREAAETAREGVVLVLFSLPGCHYCDEVRAQHLVPLLAEQRGRVAIVEVDLASRDALHDFSGVRVTQRDFARAQGARLAPTVMAFRGGERIGEPIVGAKIPEFYGHYLAQLLDRARSPSGSAQGLR